MMYVPLLHRQSGIVNRNPLCCGNFETNLLLWLPIIFFLNIQSTPLLSYLANNLAMWHFTSITSKDIYIIQATCLKVKIHSCFLFICIPFEHRLSLAVCQPDLVLSNSQTEILALSSWALRQISCSPRAREIAWEVPGRNNTAFQEK